MILNLAGDNVCAMEKRFEKEGDIGGVCFPEGNRDNVKRYAEGRGSIYRIHHCSERVAQ